MNIVEPGKKTGEVDVKALPGTEVCDFCSSEDVRWEIDCGVVLVDGVGSRDAWAACDKCAELISNEKWQELRAHSIDTMSEQFPFIPRELQEEFIAKLHGQFRLKHGVMRPRAIWMKMKQSICFRNW